MKLYKYVPFSEGSKNILINSTMKFSSAEEFNDPFDCVVSHDVEGSLAYVLTRNDLLESAKKLNPENFDKKIMLDNLRHSLESGQFSSDMASSFGICSLSSSNDNILMWSHYADNHKGFIVEFQQPTNFNEYLSKPEFLLLSWPVKYQMDMPKVIMGDQGFEAVTQRFLTKALEWEYEKEHRCLAHKAGSGIHKFSPPLLVGVIAGAKMSNDDLHELKFLVKNYEEKHNLKVSFKQAKKSGDQYKLEFV
ncbi:DUF2971 domain-containing protein [Vibrio splendidus]|uniref:DUF2971 domain-containing protein n=1 Tax=Vibrio splendidus TaxID=29497 RepID=UPI000D3D10E9|nr:DUF2971 domain-containing protein [Vibrio splendidus]PTO70564.1 hypothetical protein CWN96_01205 [Vibrio splendidus]